MVERLVHTEEVTGSMPVSPTEEPCYPSVWALWSPLVERLCERPGCSDPASVAYGMRAEDLIFWLDRLQDEATTPGGVLCQRHADSMVVPRNWTLDDLRDPELHLFRPPTAAEGSSRPSRRGPANSDDTGEQLALRVEAAAIADLEQPEPVVANNSDDPDDSSGGDDRSDTWTPAFDVDDDLDGLLAARSPLLARAFRGDDRPRR